MTIFVILLILLFVLLFIGKAEAKYQANKKIKKAFESNLIYEKDFDSLTNQLQFGNIKPLDVESEIQSYKREKYIRDKYNDDTADKILNQVCWIGMSEEQLVDTRGIPTKIEKEELKTKTKITYVYGKKYSGDSFIVEDKQVVKILDKANFKTYKHKLN
jgi:hypothetical protein